MKGRVAVYQGPGQSFELREYAVPEVGAEDILVRIRAANVCGSDIHIWHGRGPGLPKGCVAGHEMVGEVFRLGREVTTDCLGQPLRDGDRVVFAYFMPCGACAACLTGLPTCPNRYRHWVRPADEPPHFRGAYGDYYYLRVTVMMYMSPPEAEAEPTEASSSSHLQLAVGLTALATLILGLLPTGILDLAQAAWQGIAQKIAAR